MTTEVKLASPTIIRTIAIISVIAIHATGEAITTQMNVVEIYRWNVVNVYQSLFRVAGIPLFVMLSGFLLLQPEKFKEPIKVFLRKRFSRLALPVAFFGVIYYIWDFLVKNQPASVNYVIQSLASTGPYYHFWYIYMLVGLYLLTPLLRVLLPNMSRSLLTYFMVIWFVGITVTGLFPLFGYAFDSNVFLLTGYVGYFVLGAFLPRMKVRKSVLVSSLIPGIAVISVGSYYMAAIGNPKLYYFQEYLSPIVILTSMVLFIFLSNISFGGLEIHRKTNWLVNKISDNTLPIFLLHLIVLESLQKGYFFGFTISGNSLNSIVEVPLITVVTLAICLAIVIVLGKIPVLRTLTGAK